MASYSRERPKTIAYVGWPYALSPLRGCSPWHPFQANRTGQHSHIHTGGWMVSGATCWPGGCRLIETDASACAGFSLGMIQP